MDTDLARLVAVGVERTLSLAGTWLCWDGRARLGEGGGRAYTPHKAMRRTTDHLIDHLAEVQALLCGAEPMPDGWLASYFTAPSDLAPFTEQDLNEAAQRLRRLAAQYEWTLTAAGSDAWDEPRSNAKTIREIVEHVAGAWYAEQVGDVTATAAKTPGL